MNGAQRLQLRCTGAGGGPVIDGSVDHRLEAIRGKRGRRGRSLWLSSDVLRDDDSKNQARRGRWWGRIVGGESCHREMDGTKGAGLTRVGQDLKGIQIGRA